MGDPNQDLNGFGCLKRLIQKYTTTTVYSSDCFRCPQVHLDISNNIINATECQYSAKKGNICYNYESDVNVPEFIDKNKYDLMYISRKTRLFSTKSLEKISLETFETLFYEVHQMLISISPLDTEDIKLKVATYRLSCKLVNLYTLNKNESTTMNSIFPKRYWDMEAKYYARICQALKLNSECNKDDSLTHVHSINSIKGCEGTNCLFVLTTDLAPYLFGEKDEDNKTKNKLYVALTRSLHDLTFLISLEVEKKYGEKYIDNYFSQIDRIS